MEKGDRSEGPRRDIPSPENLHYRRAPQTLAEQENQGLLNQINLEREAGKHGREERFRDLIAKGVSAIMRAVFVVLFITVVVFAWHYLAPEKAHWLSEDQLTVLRTVLFSGVIAGAMSSYFQKYG